MAPVTTLFASLYKIHECCLRLDNLRVVQELNETAEKHFCSSGNSLIGTDFIQIIHPGSVLRIEHALTRASAGESIHEEGKVIHPEGGVLEFDFFFAPCRDENENTGILVIGKDVTEAKRKEIDRLRFYNVAENTVNPLQITDLSGRMIYVNSAFEKMSGYSKEELIGSNPSLLSSGKFSRKFWDAMWNTISSGKVWTGEIENTKKNGEPMFTQLLISPILDDAGKVIGYFGVHRDLTEKRNLEKQLIHTQKMESIGTLAAGVAHEVGNPLASISALVQIIQRSTDDQFIKEKLELVKRQVTRISKIIRDLVDFSRPSNYELRLTDVNENIMESIEIVRVGKKAKNIQFKSDLDASIPPLALVADQIQQVFVNILINAVDAILEQQSREEDPGQGWISAQSYMTHNVIRIIFEDSGTGVTDENQVKIFEPFFTTKKEGKGTGLGLWVSYGIIKSFQGSVVVENNESGGARFIIELPVTTN